MPFTKSKRRFDDLLANGLRDWEADVLQVIPLHVPYLATLKSERAKQVNKLKAQGYSDAQIDNAIARGYSAKGYTRGKGVRSPESVWAMLRGIETPFKSDHPEYKPKYKHHRARDTAATMEKVNNSLDKMSVNQLKNARDTTSDVKQWQRYNNELKQRGK